jgi:molybdopterin-guanine dinucleotide biosynthesis protein A
MQAAGFVLAGGKSTRMGRDKALLELNGITLVERALQSLSEVCAEVAIAGGAPELERYGRVIPDVTPGCGPLGGIVAALEQTRWEWNLFVPVDVPFVPRAAWLAILERAAAEDALTVMARAGGRAGGQVQPLCAAYSQAALAGLRRELHAGHWKVTAAAAAAGQVAYVDFDEDAWFRNFNTPEEFVTAQTKRPRGGG